ncbi:MAG: LamG domain-containing protein, partial [Sedimentisphaerales bacterium]|nr:LamG domain-containing protein [Sedimentisphaerales bacterium]
NKYGSELVPGYIPRRGWYFRVESSGAIKTRVVNAAQTGTSLVSDTGLGVVEVGTWAHMATTYEYVADGSSKIRLYLNGELVGGTDTAVGPINIISDWPAWIGAYQYNAEMYSSYFDGVIDDVRIYNQTLSSAEINMIYGDSHIGCFEIPAGDYNEDCKVDLADFAILSSSWLECVK